MGLDADEERHLIFTFTKLNPSPARRRTGAQPPPLWSGEEHLRELLGDRVELETLERDVREMEYLLTVGRKRS
jgi:hypothetical protein